MSRLGKACGILGLVGMLGVFVTSAEALTSTSTVSTRVGSPKSTDFCPIPNGQITCGSKFTPIAGCGHCSPEYIRDFSAESVCAPGNGTEYAIDIAARAGQEIILPSVNGESINWIGEGEASPGTGTIQFYSGKDSAGKNYWLQFHHTQSGSGIAKGSTAKSGEKGGNVCSNCLDQNGYHSHVQIAQVTPQGKQWLDAAKYFCGQP